MELALSTMWGIGKFKTLSEFFDAGHALGFTRFELNHAVDSAMLDGLNLNSCRIVSVHEPCPADVSVAHLKQRDWLISSLNEENRRHGIAAIQKSIALAQRLGAQAVIVHPGRVDMDASFETTLRDLYQQGKARQSEYARLTARYLRERATRVDKNLRAVERSVLELAEYAGERGIKLGLENRYHYHEIPLPAELEKLLALAPPEVLGFWYDVGHAHTLEQLGLGAHEEWLRRFVGRMVGVHLHDVVGITDHRAAGSGKVNWEMVARFLPAAILRTCEFQNDNSTEQVASGVRWIVAQGCAEA